MYNFFNSKFAVYHERQPEHYVGADDVSVTITSNNKGFGTAKMIEDILIELDNGTLRIEKNEK